MSRRKGRHLNTRQAVWEIWGPCCYLCGFEFESESDPWTLEHVIPKALMGEKSLYNLRVACAGCNELKADSLNYWSPQFRRWITVEETLNEGGRYLRYLAERNGGHIPGIGGGRL